MLLNSEPLAEDLGLLLLRLGAGGTMVWSHGWSKLIHFTERMDSFGDPLGLGPAVSLALITFAETICASLVALGLWTRASTIPLLIGMAVAAFASHGGDIAGKGELSFIFLIAFATILLCGSGRFAIDRISFK
ncbi:MAG: DoxX family protein [Flavobacteriales bacterium]|nr:DoxX family protein [Flavobacteriales bacterium]